MPRRKQARRILITLGVLCILGVVAWLALPSALAPIIAAKLKAAAEAHLHARLDIGRIDYSFPYRVRAHTIRLTHLADNSEWFSASTIDFALVALPIRSGPLQIQHIGMGNPSLRIVHAAHVVRRADSKPPSPKEDHVKPPAVEMKLSDLFLLRLMSIRNGTIVYEDAAGAAPLVWAHINSDLRLTPQSASRYGWNITADDQASAHIAATGNIDIDRLEVSVVQLTIDAAADPSNVAALPSQIQEALRRFAIQGAARLEATGEVPVSDPQAARFTATLHLQNAQATVGAQELRGDVSLAAVKLPGPAPVTISAPSFTARIGEGTLNVARAAAQIDVTSGAWRLAELAAEFEQLALAPPGFDEPLQQLSGSIQLEGGQLIAREVKAKLGPDSMSLALARGELLDGGTAGIALHDIDLTVQFADSTARASGPVGRILAPLNPAGEFTFRGRYERRVATPDDYELLVATRGGSLSVGPQRVPITNIRGDVSLTPRRIAARRLTGSVFDGTLTAAGDVDTSGGDMTYHGEASVQQLDIAALARHFASTDGPRRLAGRADANLTFKGRGASAESIAANGELRITQGHLWEVPLLQRIVSRIKLAREALTAGEAAALFEVANSKVHVRGAALNSPALGLHGTGTVGFDGELNLDVTAAPLGDWEQHIRKTGVPLVSDLAGSFVGAAQNLLRTATSELLFQFKVTGPTSDPRVEPIPAPILTESGAHLLARMIRRDVNLLDMLKEKPQK